MSIKKYYWIPVYKCRACGRKEVSGNKEHRLNEFGKLIFPSEATPETVRHECTPGLCGVADLIGLQRKKKEEE